MGNFSDNVMSLQSVRGLGGAEEKEDENGGGKIRNEGSLDFEFNYILLNDTSFYLLF